MPDSFIPYGADPATVGRRSASVKRTETRDGVAADFHRDEVHVVDKRVVTYSGSVGTFRQPGLAGTVGQKLFAIHNATGSTVLVDVHSLEVSLFDTATKVVAPPVARAWRFTAIPTGGNAVAKRGKDSAQTSNASVTLWQGASADGTASTAALAVTLPAEQFVSQKPASRALTLVGVEPDREIDLLDETGDMTLRAGQGISVFLDYTVATSNPITDVWMVNAVWSEYVPS